jgi:hypothetical protein
VTTLLAKLLEPFDRVSKSVTVWTLSYNGENMDSCEVPHAPDNAWSIDAYLEMEDRLNSLRSLVCDLLKKNHELPLALLETRSTKAPVSQD